MCEVWAGFRETVDGVRHAVIVPAVTIYRTGDSLIEDYRVFIDLAPLFARREWRDR